LTLGNSKSYTRISLGTPVLKGVEVNAKAKLSLLIVTTWFHAQRLYLFVGSSNMIDKNVQCEEI
jgi:hypothetical protein